LIGDAIFIRPAVRNKTDDATHKWVCRGWISDNSGEKGGTIPEAVQALLSQQSN